MSYQANAVSAEDRSQLAVDHTPSLREFPTIAPRASRIGPQAMRAIAQVIELTVARATDDLTMVDLAKAAAIPANSLTRIFNRRYGISPKRWVWYFRTVLAAELIVAKPEWPLATISARCGFNSAAHFSRRFRDIFEQTPTHFRMTFLATGRRGQTRHAAQARFRLMIEDCTEAVGRTLDQVLEKAEPTAAPAFCLPGTRR